MDLPIKTLEVLLNDRTSCISTTLGVCSMQEETSNRTNVSIKTMFRLWDGRYHEED